MKRILLGALLSLLTMHCSVPKPPDLKDVPSQYVTTFQLTTPDKIIVDNFTMMSDTIPSSTTEMADPGEIKKVIALLFQLPDQGDVMVKMGNVPLTRLRLVFKERVEVIEFYNGRIKTPATSFYAEPNPIEAEILSLVSR